MRKEISSGGVVVFGNAVLLLKKYNGDWVLPKGKVKTNEALHDAAVREVFEEAAVKAEIIKYLGEINYIYQNNREEDEENAVNKTVHWFLMQSKSIYCIPLKEEGFIEAMYVHINRAAEQAKYDDEKEIIRKAIYENNKTSPY